MQFIIAFKCKINDATNAYEDSYYLILSLLSPL